MRSCLCDQILKLFGVILIFKELLVIEGDSSLHLSFFSTFVSPGSSKIAALSEFHHPK